MRERWQAVPSALAPRSGTGMAGLIWARSRGPRGTCSHQALANPLRLRCLQQVPEVFALQQLGRAKKGFPRGLQRNREREMPPMACASCILPRLGAFLGLGGKEDAAAGERYLFCTQAEAWGKHHLRHWTLLGLQRRSFRCSGHREGCQHRLPPVTAQLRNAHLSHALVLVVHVEEERQEDVAHFLLHLCSAGVPCNLHGILTEKDGELPHVAGLLVMHKGGTQSCLLQAHVSLVSRGLGLANRDPDVCGSPAHSRERW